MEFREPLVAPTTDKWNQKSIPYQLSDRDQKLMEEGQIGIKMQGTLGYVNGFSERDSVPFCGIYAYREIDTRLADGNLRIERQHDTMDCDDFPITLKVNKESNRKARNGTR